MSQALTQLELNLVYYSFVDIDAHLAGVVEDSIVIAEEIVEAALRDHAMDLKHSWLMSLFLCQILHQVWLILIEIEVDIHVWRNI